MREARIIMPLAQHLADARAEHERLELLLSRNFGGCTVSCGRGSWVDGAGKLVTEPVAIFDIAMPDTDLNTDRLTILAHETAQRLEQDSVYIRYADGRVFIDKVGKPGRKLVKLDFVGAADVNHLELTPAELAGTIAPPRHDPMFEATRETQGIREVDYLP